ncbi:MAG: hypothetical protein L3J63_11830 [Geopsychrobacter sp.]|nr:hypothetical protein [Geopsychrobacter sp.]
MPKPIKVKAKINGGHHPIYGQIVKGQTYTIHETHFGDQLFERPSKNWKAPWERTDTQAKEN